MKVYNFHFNQTIPHYKAHRIHTTHKSTNNHQTKSINSISAEARVLHDQHSPHSASFSS